MFATGYELTRSSAVGSNSGWPLGGLLVRHGGLNGLPSDRRVIDAAGEEEQNERKKQASHGHNRHFNLAGKKLKRKVGK